MSEQGTHGATPSEPTAGATPATTPSTGATPEAQSPSPDPAREAQGDGEHTDPREAGLGEEGRRLLRETRQAQREAERELKALREEKRARDDAGKSEVQRLSERADEAERRANAAERRIQSVEVAAEFGISEWADELASDSDTRTMRAHAQRIRERLGRGTPGMDGGVRSYGQPPQARSMDDLIREGSRR
jgi:hypothetical protein